jgi:5-formyltetrahydrofolate cyclo-ligase
MKARIRQQLRKQRRGLNARAHRIASTLANKAVMRLPMFAAGKRIGLYLPFDKETDTADLIAAARRRGVRIFVPVISDRRHRRLRFLPLVGKTTSGTFGIAVPRHSGRPVAPRWLNLIIVPLVGIDEDGRRLGMGGGYYDRALEFRRRRRQWMGPHLVGLAFDCQRTKRGFADAWDLRLDSLASESGLQHFLEETS